MYRCCGLPWHNGPKPKCTYTNFSCTATMTAQISLWNLNPIFSQKTSCSRLREIRLYRELLLQANEELHLVRCPKIRLCMFIEVLCFVKNHENVFHYILYCYWGQSSLCTTMVALYTPPNFLLVLIVHRRLCDSGIADHRSQQLCIWISQANMKLEAPILHNIFLIQNFAEM